MTAKKKDRPNIGFQLIGTKITPWVPPQNSEQALAEFLAECRCYFGLWDRQVVNEKEFVESLFVDDDDATEYLAILRDKWKEYLHHLNRERHG